jgi:hypothetical protein
LKEIRAVTLAFTCVGLVEKVAVMVLVGTFVVIANEPEPVSPFWVSLRLIDLKTPTDGGGS